MLNKQEKAKNIAIFIDSENVSPYYIKSILSEISKWGNIIVRNAYGSFFSPILLPWQKVIQEESLTARVTESLVYKKNSSDIALTVEAMDILYQNKPDMLVLVSSDSDYSALIKKFNCMGVETVGIGEEKTSKSFQFLYRTFIFLESFQQEYYCEQRKEKVLNNASDKELISLLKEAVLNTKDEKNWANIANVGNFLSKKYSFNSLNYGHKKLVDLFKSVDGFNIKYENTTAYISLKVMNFMIKKEDNDAS